MIEPNEIDCRCTCKECESRTQETYRLKVSCGNCGWNGVAILRKGDKPSWMKECPHCGRDRLYYGTDPIFDAPAPAQSREEDSLERMLNHVSRLLHYDDGRPADVQMIEAARLIDAELAALRSRQSPPPSSNYPPGCCAKCGAPVPHHYVGCPTAAPQPSPQGEDAEALVEELVSIAYDANMKTDTGFRRMKCKIRDALRARLASSQSSAQGEEAREMRG